MRLGVGLKSLPSFARRIFRVRPSNAFKPELCFHPRQRSADAKVNALSECQMGSGVGAADVESLRVGEMSVVAIFRSTQQKGFGEVLLISVRGVYSRVSSQRSVSSAAMHPVPAAVTACL